MRLLIRSYFSTRLLWAACHAGDDARAIEDSHTGEPTFNVEHNGHILSAIVLSAAFLEAAINEFFQDAHDEHLPPDGYLAALPNGALRAMAAVWRGTDDGRRLTALEKWQLMLVLAGRDPLHPGRAPFQAAKLVFDLRNVIVHYRPEDLATDDTHKLESGLRRGSSPTRFGPERAGRGGRTIAWATAAQSGPLHLSWNSPIASVTSLASRRTTGASPLVADTARHRPTNPRPDAHSTPTRGGFPGGTA